MPKILNEKGIQTIGKEGFLIHLEDKINIIRLETPEIPTLVVPYYSIDHSNNTLLIASVTPNQYHAFLIRPKSLRKVVIHACANKDIPFNITTSGNVLSRLIANDALDLGWVQKFQIPEKTDDVSVSDIAVNTMATAFQSNEVISAFMAICSVHKLPADVSFDRVVEASKKLAV